MFPTDQYKDDAQCCAIKEGHGVVLHHGIFGTRKSCAKKEKEKFTKYYAGSVVPVVEVDHQQGDPNQPHNQWQGRENPQKEPWLPNSHLRRSRKSLWKRQRMLSMCRLFI